MKRHLMLIINLFTFIFIVPFLIFFYVITGLVIGLAFDLDSYLIPDSEATAHPRIKHIVMLPPIKLAPVVTEVEPAQVSIPATPIESDPEPQEFAAVETAASSTSSQGTEETAIASISTPAEDLAVDEAPTEIITVEPASLEIVAESETPTVAAPIVEEADSVENTATPQNDTPMPVENLTSDQESVEPEPVEPEIVEVAEETTLPVSSSVAETEQTEIAAPPQDDPPTPSEPAPDASYFDKLLDRVKQ
ncbi:MAG: hypothetical protein GY934_01405 [Gammaproteobacteria bacterium]|nr:hypothetical protein [Gammaproteobacteria bacterium]